MNKIIQLGFLLLLFCCETKNPENATKLWKAEIMQVEQDFNHMAQDKGLVEAFHFYAADDGVIKRNRKIVAGKAAIKAWYANDVSPNETLTWTPTFIDVSNSGDLAYTYGDFVFTSIDSIGNKKENKGIFHTVWKRQKDGQWRFVWD